VRRLVNVVGTRAVRGEHEQLVRWYADHVHQLMAFDGLRGAALHRRRGDHDLAPEYLCLYDFTDRAAFEAYERSDVHAQAAQDRLLGWGRDGIEITLRTQHERLYWCASGTDGAACHVHALRAPPSTERVLAAQAIERGADAFALLRAIESPSPVADYLLIEQSAAGMASLSGIEIAWHAGYERLRRWWR
jgi:hypothetical protein